MERLLGMLERHHPIVLPMRLTRRPISWIGTKASHYCRWRHYATDSRTSQTWLYILPKYGLRWCLFVPSSMSGKLLFYHYYYYYYHYIINSAVVTGRRKKSINSWANPGYDMNMYSLHSNDYEFAVLICINTISFAGILTTRRTYSCHAVLYAKLQVFHYVYANSSSFFPPNFHAEHRAIVCERVCMIAQIVNVLPIIILYNSVKDVSHYATITSNMCQNAYE